MVHMVPCSCWCFPVVLAERST